MKPSTVAINITLALGLIFALMLTLHVGVRAGAYGVYRYSPHTSLYRIESLTKTISAPKKSNLSNTEPEFFQKCKSRLVTELDECISIKEEIDASNGCLVHRVHSFASGWLDFLQASGQVKAAQTTPPRLLNEIRELQEISESKHSVFFAPAPPPPPTHGS